MSQSSARFDATKLAAWLFYLNGAIWLALGVGTLLGAGRATAIPPSIVIIIAILMAGNALAMVISGIGVERRVRLLYFFALAVLMVNIALSVTDEVGALDLITLVIDIVLFILLLVYRKRFARSDPA